MKFDKDKFIEGITFKQNSEYTLLDYVAIGTCLLIYPIFVAFGALDSITQSKSSTHRKGYKQ